MKDIFSSWDDSIKKLESEPCMYGIEWDYTTSRNVRKVSSQNLDVWHVELELSKELENKIKLEVWLDINQNFENSKNDNFKVSTFQHLEYLESMSLENAMKLSISIIKNYIGSMNNVISKLSEVQGDF